MGGGDAELLRPPIEELRAAAAAAGQPPPEVVMLTTLAIEDPPRAAEQVRALAAVGATRVVHAWRYPDPVAFARGAEVVGVRIRAALHA
jgi:hypothetical protein